jgi:RNA polymerase sigma-70 factor (ECF subfamily)
MSNPNIASRFDEIYNSTNKAALGFITAKCGRTADIQDIFQDTYVELYQVLLKRGAEYITNEKALVLKIAKRKVAKYYSLLERLRFFVSANTVSEDGESVDLSDFEADSFLIEDYVVNQEMLEIAKSYVHSKPETVQKIFYLFYDVELSISEISQELSINESSVKNNLYRTLKELRNLLK